MKIGITLGDPAGIGPEIILKALIKFKNINDFLIFGNKKIFKKTALDLNLCKNFNHIKDKIVDCVRLIEFRYGKPTRKTGCVAIESIDNALQSNVDIIITAPIVKEVVKETILDFVGHTEYLAKFYNTKNFAMVGLLKNKRIMLLTTHLPLQDIFKMIKPANILEKITLFNWGLKKYFIISRPTIGVSALNPHGFEFSRGEEEQIKQGIMLAQNQGIDAHGPFPGDSLFTRNFDGFLSIYHDQAFVYLKSRKGGVNWTLGLPIIRLSPLYGAALDIAGRNKADFSGMVAALRVGIKLYRNSQKRTDRQRNGKRMRHNKMEEVPGLKA